MLPSKVFTEVAIHFEATLYFSLTNFLAYNNIAKSKSVANCRQISLQSAAVDCSFSDNLIPLGVANIGKPVV